MNKNKDESYQIKKKKNYKNAIIKTVYPWCTDRQIG